MGMPALAALALTYRSTAMALELVVSSKVARDWKEVARAQALYWAMACSSIPSWAATFTVAWYSSGETWSARVVPSEYTCMAANSAIWAWSLKSSSKVTWSAFRMMSRSCLWKG